MLVVITTAATASAALSREADDWTALRRPLHFPRANKTCPRTDGRKASEFSPFGTNFALGRGPVYPMFDVHPEYRPNSVGSMARFNATRLYHGWYVAKILWIVDSRYQGPVLIRGARIDKRGRLFPDQGLDLELRLPRASSSATDWRSRPTLARIAVGGCYGFQVDGDDFSTTITFPARVVPA